LTQERLFEGLAGVEGDFFLGIDAGSVALKTAAVSPDGRVLTSSYLRHEGRPLELVERLCRELLADAGAGRGKLLSVAFTGSGGRAPAAALSAYFYNEVLAASRAAAHLTPDAASVVDIGGEESKLIALDRDGGVRDFAMNTMCAAGTGSFLDQQATRLGLSIEEFGRTALRSEHPPRIAGRCSVFAKSDMIHLQQMGAADYDIVAGLCYALARSLAAGVFKGLPVVRPVVFVGGVASNPGMVRAVKDVLSLGEGDLIIPPAHACFGAIGAALLAAGEAGRAPLPSDACALLAAAAAGADASVEPLRPLRDGPPAEGPVELDLFSHYAAGTPGAGAKEVYLGIDIGSISTKVVAVDREGRLAAKNYLLTMSRPLESVRRGLELVRRDLGDDVVVRGVGTTGSGRYLIADFVGGDVVRNEITAQARAAVQMDPDVDTIFEIGGQDSKYVSLASGAVVDFSMNKVCAAGTGSFLEEQAERLGMDIAGEFSAEALASRKPIPLGERCTVFMESNLVAHQQRGAERGDLSAGLAYSIALNYLNRVVDGRKVGERIFFQGAVAFNEAVVAALARLTGRQVVVPPNNHVTGAIGAALEALASDDGRGCRFRGFDEILGTPYKLESFECGDCPNACEVKVVRVEGRQPLFYGSRCEKYDVRRRKREHSHDMPDLFAERERLLVACLDEAEVSDGTAGPRVGVPRTLIFAEFLPLWVTFLRELGCRVVVSGSTNGRTMQNGISAVASEPCLPVKAAHGHVLELLEKGVDYLFLPIPASVKETHHGLRSATNCPYVQVLGALVNSSIDLASRGVKIVSPVLLDGLSRRVTLTELKRVAREMGLPARRVRAALEAGERAQEEFYRAVAARGREVLAGLDGSRPTAVIVGRPYNACDRGLNLDLGGKLLDLGVLPVPMEFLPLDEVDLSVDFPDMYWRYGQRILAAGKIVRGDSRLAAVYVTNFGCGPDSFISHYFSEVMSGKPFLQLEVDEHSADAGLVTRCEAFLDSIRNRKPAPPPPKPRVAYPRFDPKRTRRLYIPLMGESSHGLAAAFRAYGVDARPFPKSCGETLALGRAFTNGRECYPCILTTGDMVRITRQPDFDPESSAFFMPTTDGPCRFGQYNRLQRMVLDELGFRGVPILSPNQGEDFYRQLGVGDSSFFRLAWRGVTAADILGRLLRRTRPYELHPGDADDVYESSLKRVTTELERGGRGLEGELRLAAQRFAKVRNPGAAPKPLVGVVGEIFVRSNEFANEEVVRALEGFGAEVTLSSVLEWFYHTNRSLRLKSILTHDVRLFLQVQVKSRLQRAEERRLSRVCLDGQWGRPEEAPVEELWRNSEPFLPGWFGEASLSAGKTVEYASRGVCGVVNVMPFTCLPGNIAASVLKSVRRACDDIPLISVAYDGVEDATLNTRLEAFVHQAARYGKQRK